MWKLLYESIEGTSHDQSGVKCQDASYGTPHGKSLILACSDGAGSALDSRLGAESACRAASLEVASFLDTRDGAACLTSNEVMRWARLAHEAIQNDADERGIPIRELACTLLLSVITPTCSAFLQIGDGAIVIARDQEYRCVFWPQSGEYHNTTYFITDEQFEDRVQVAIFDHAVDELAMMTDGLQMLALNFANRTVHSPFFAPMFTALRHTQDTDELIVPLRQFLNSDAVNSRTDDDKTLMLATQVRCGDTAG